MAGPIVQALGTMADGPEEIVSLTGFMAQRQKVSPPTEREIVAALVDPDQNREERIRFTELIHDWERSRDGEWTNGTAPYSTARRARIHALLEWAPDSAAAIDRAYPRDPAAVVIEDKPAGWEPWLLAERIRRNHFYWNAYQGVLRSKGWSPEALAKLDTATYDIVRQLADPTRDAPYQSKGLTVGYVQSGKTANFTGVLAKAMDAGYRLIIVLTGTLELLRRQTQRRLDMELIGVENIIGGIDENDLDAMAKTDYHGDADWDAGKFLRHGVPIHNRPDIPGIIRLSSYDGDYKSLKQGLHALDFRGHGQMRDPRKPLYDPENLFASSVRIAVVKKNSAVLQKLVDDLGKIHADLREIPTLIIDDEADQASVNTRKPKPAEKKERTAINQRISDLLQKLPRAQYIGYTATPFANVFVDPDDAEDIFPKDFIVALERPPGYMGAADFHDLDTDIPASSRNVRNSNEKRYVRDLWPLEPDLAQGERQAALDAFVLAGAIKLYRQRHTDIRFRHHTMLVHQSVKQTEHRETRDAFVESWHRAAYSSPAAITRLRTLYETDHRPVRDAVVAEGFDETELPLPDTFDELVNGGHLSEAISRIERGQTPVLIVNGDKEKDYEQDALDFEKDDVWKILVGGTKLSRGFTVEGLTVSFYTRRTEAADTLMQMGRWFGFRKGYRDLIRLFIAREVPGARNTTVDLYEAFEAIVRDEEDFRAELRQFADVEEETGQAMVRPADVPPLVFQRLPWLKPTQSNKMYNRRLVSRGAGGKVVDFPYVPARGAGRVNRRHLELIRPFLDALTERGEFTDDLPTAADGKPLRFEAEYGVVPVALVIEVLEQFTWADGWEMTADLAFLRELVEKGKVTDFTVLLPHVKDAAERTIDGIGRRPLLKRSRREDRSGFSGSSKRQRPAIETLAGRRLDAPPGVEPERDRRGGPLAESLYRPDRGALLLTLVYDPKEKKARDPKRIDADSVVAPEDVAVLLSWALPYDAAPRAKIGFQAIKSGGAIVSRTPAD